MNTSAIHPGDIIQCDVRGDLFYAMVESPLEKQRDGRKAIKISSLTRRPIPTLFVTSYQIKKHWRRRGAGKGKE